MTKKLLLFKRVFLLCVLAISAYAQGNLQLALTHSDDYAKWFVHNESNQAITAYFFHAGDEPMHLLNGQNVGVGELKLNSPPNRITARRSTTLTIQR